MQLDGGMKVAIAQPIPETVVSSNEPLLIMPRQVGGSISHWLNAAVIWLTLVAVVTSDELFVDKPHPADKNTIVTPTADTSSLCTVVAT